MSEEIEKLRRHFLERQGGNPASIDGFLRSGEAEKKLNAACAQLFSTPNGKLVMDYLKSITINAIMGAGSSDAELRDMEGRRRIVGILQTRAQQGKG